MLTSFESFRERLSALNRSGRNGRPAFSFWGLGTGLVIALGWFLFSPVLTGSAIWDDHAILGGQAIGGGRMVDALTGTFNGQYYRPLTSLSYAFDLSFFGPDPFSFHVTNNLIHLIGALLALWAAWSFSKNRVVALFTGLFFVVQPSQLVATAWIGGRTDALSCVFIFLLIGALANYQSSKKLGWYGLALLAYFCAIMTKEQNICLVFLAPLSEMLLGERKWKQAFAQMAVFLAVSVAFLWLWVVYYPAPSSPAPVTLASLAGRFFTSIAHYTFEYLTPTGYTLSTYSLANYQSILWPILGALIGGLGIWGMVTLHRRAPRLAWLAWGAIFAYLPISNLVPIPSLLVGPYRVAESGPFIAILLASSIPVLFRCRRPALVALPLANLAWCAAVAPWTVQLLSSESTFFGGMHRYDPYGLVGAGNYYATLWSSGQPAEVEQGVMGVLHWVLDPWDGRSTTAVARFKTPEVQAKIVRFNGLATSQVSALMVDLASALERKNQAAEALNFWLVARKFDETYYLPLDFLGAFYATSDPKKAMRYYRTSLSMNPDDPFSTEALGRLLLQTGHYGNAAGFLRNAIYQQPDRGTIWYELAEADAHDHNIPEAVYALRYAQGTLGADREAIEKKIDLLKAEYAKQPRRR